MYCLSVLSLLALPVSVFCAVDNSGWSWEGGGQALSAPGVYGEKGVPSPSNVPGARSDASSWTDPNNTLWLFGGINHAGSAFNDLWSYRNGMWTWESGNNTVNIPGILGPAGVPGAGYYPGARKEAVAWCDSTGTAWLFAGARQTAPNSASFGHDLWRWRDGLWAWMKGNVPGNAAVRGTKGQPHPDNIPNGRSSASGWVDSTDTLWYFGGSAGGYFNDLWSYRNDMWTWESGNIAADPPVVFPAIGASGQPGGRSGAAIWVDKQDVLWLFGGYAGYFGYYGDLWSYQGNDAWTYRGGANITASPGVYGELGVPSPENKPGARVDKATWVDVYGSFWLYGGAGYPESGGSQSLDDLWEYKDSMWTWHSGSKTGNIPRVYTGPDKHPGTRFGPASWTDTNNHLWVFGGTTSDPTFSRLNDLWKFNLTTPIAPTFTPATTTAPSVEDSSASEEASSSVDATDVTLSSSATTEIASENIQSTEGGVEALVFIIGGSVLGVVVFVAIGCLVGLLIMRKKKNNTRSTEHSEDGSAHLSMELHPQQPDTAYRSLPQVPQRPIQESTRVSTPVDKLVQYDIPAHEVQLLEQLGAGSSGVVHKAMWRMNTVAVKSISTHKQLSAKAIDDFYEEVKLVKALKPNPNVLAVFGIMANPNMCIVMEYCHNGSLDQHLFGDTIFSIDKLQNIAQGIAKGLLHLHMERIIHRDVAPRNVLLTEHWEAKLADFGLSRTLNEESDMGHTESDVGPLKHMAPECIISMKYSTKSDVWAFGVTLYEIIVRKEPYAEMSAVQAASAVAYTGLRLSVPGHLAASFKEEASIMSDCFAAHPDHRPTMNDITARLQRGSNNQYAF